VGGVTPGKGGAEVAGLPVFNTVAAAQAETAANAAIIYVPARFAVDALYEAIDAQLDPLVCITEGVPVLDMIKVVAYAHYRGVRLIGPNSPGVISPGLAKAGIMPGEIHRPGGVGVISRSGTLTYEVVWGLTQHGLGQSTCVGIGGDPIIGSDFVEMLALFEADQDTEAIVLIGEIGGRDEIIAADFIRDHITKPVVAFVAGKTAPPSRRMGHAGAIISGQQETAAAKIEALEAAGVAVADRPETIPELIETLLQEG
jgi:succinyl-CoA synthetase alpha subunit